MKEGSAHWTSTNHGVSYLAKVRLLHLAFFSSLRETVNCTLYTCPPDNLYDTKIQSSLECTLYTMSSRSRTDRQGGKGAAFPLPVPPTRKSSISADCGNGIYVCAKYGLRGDLCASTVFRLAPYLRRILSLPHHTLSFARLPSRLSQGFRFPLPSPLPTSTGF